MDLTLSDKELYELLVGTFMPLLIAAVNRPTWSARTKQLVASALCVVAALGTAYFTGALDPANALRSVMVVLLMSHTTYHTIYRPSGLTDKLEQGL